METQPAQLVSVRETINGDGYIFRDETLVSASSGGGANYMYENGQLVPSGVKIADIYAGSNTDEIKQQINELDEQIAIIQDSSLSGSALLTDSESVDSSISSLYYSMLGKLNSDEPDYVFRRSDDMLILLNKRQLILKTVTDFSQRISELQSQKVALSSSLSTISESIYTDKSGYFFNEADGYENIFSSSAVDMLTVQSFNDIIKSSPDDSIINSPNVIGKIMNSNVWYVGVELNSGDTADFIEGKKYTMVFPYSSDIELSMELYRIVTDRESDKVLLVFSTGSVPSNFNFLRMQSVEIVKNTYKGYRVPVSAVRIVDDKKGVYILNGNVVEFKTIDSLVEIAGNLIVKEQDKINDKDYNSKLGFYDRIIVKGKNLYEHKIIG